MNPVSRASRKRKVNQENNLDLSKPHQIQCSAKELWNGPWVVSDTPVTSRRLLRVPSGMTTATQGDFGETTCACQMASRTPPEIRSISCVPGSFKLRLSLRNVKVWRPAPSAETHNTT